MSDELYQGEQMSTPEPNPKPNDLPAVWDLVIADMKARDESGRAKYGTPLQPYNGRKQLVDAYQEVLDLAVYLRAEIEERIRDRARETQERVRAQEEGQARDVEWWALHRRVLVEVYHRPHQLRAAALALGLEE